MHALTWMLAASAASAQEPPPGEPELDCPELVCPELDCPELVCPEPPMTEADAALLDALLLLLDEGAPADGATALGLLADPRSLWVLRHSVIFRPPVVGAAAARALAAFPEARGDLLGWVRTPTLADEVRVAAAESLAAQQAPDGADAILDALADRLTSPTLEARLRQVLAAGWPARLPEASERADSDGTALLMAGAGVGMGYALAATGHFGQSGLEALGALTGAAGGATLGFVYGRTRPVEAGNAAFFTSSGLAGLATGTTLGVWADPSDDNGPWIGGVLGGALGYGLGLGLWKDYPGRAEDALLASGLGVASGTLVAGAVSFSVENSGNLAEDAVSGAFGLGLAAGVTAGHATAPGRELSGEDAALALGGTAYGTFLGLAMPLNGAERAGLPAATAAAAPVLVYALGPQVEVPLDVTGGGLGGLAYGAVIGGGAAMLVAPGGDEELARSLVTLGGTGGMVLGGWLAHRTPGGLQLDDAILTGLTTSWATWQTVGWASITEPDPDLEGILVLAPAVVGAGTAAASPLLSVEFGDSLAATSLGLWGAYLGSVGGTLADADRDTTLIAALAASDVGLVGGALLMSPLVDASPVVVGVADAGGVLGGSTAALVTALFTDETDPILVASLVGAGAGATGGALLGANLERRRPGAATRPGVPGLPPGLALAPAWLPHEDGGCFGLRGSYSGW